MRQLFRVSTLLSVVLAIVSGAALFIVSQHVQQSETELAKLEKAVIYEEKSFQVLRAEWDYLNSPARLEQLASEYLDLVPPDIRHVVGNGQLLPDHVAPVIPLRKPLMRVENAVYQAEPPTAYPEPPAQHYYRAPKPRSKPAYIREKNFQNLIEDLSQEGGE